MRDKPLSLVLIVLSFAIFSLAGCMLRHDISGVWKGTIQASAAGGKEKWQGSAELTLNQNGDALTGWQKHRVEEITVVRLVDSEHLLHRP